jgi:glycosyltransferase involved in cell wall biosynthesis
LASFLPVIRTRRPTLHLDPLSVVRHRLEARDIVLCHDVGPITHPQYFAPGVNDLYSQAYEQIRRTRPHMVFVSKTSRQEFHRLYGDDFASSNVIYIPTRLGVTEGEGRPVDGLTSPFVLTVGSIGDRKNQARCIEAFAASGLAEKGWRYVIVGGREPGADTAIQLAKQTPGVVMPGYTTDDELRWLYRNASGFVLMSLLEGFGMPVVEATEHNLPCLVSSSSILTEIGGEAMLDADPLDPKSIASGMRRLADMSDEERSRRISQARSHLQNFAREPILASWRELVERIVG